MQNHQGYRQETQDIDYPAIINAMVVEIASLKKKLAIAEGGLFAIAMPIDQRMAFSEWVDAKMNIAKEALAAIRGGENES